MSLTHRKPASWTVRLAAVFLMLAGLHAAYGQNPQPIPWNPTHILAVIHAPSRFYDAKAISAHRGVYNKTDCPENSACALTSAHLYPVESFEIDAKPDAQGSLWASHDLTLGRMGILSFNPQTGEGFNPPIKYMQPRDLFFIHLIALDKFDRRYVTGQKMMTVADLAYLHHHEQGSVMLIDLKTMGDLSSAAAAAAPMQDTFGAYVLKISADEISREGITHFRTAFTRGLAWAPTLYAPMLDSIYLREASGVGDTSPQEYIRIFIDKMVAEPGYQYIEIGNKAYGDPTWFALEDASIQQRGRGQFVPVPEAVDSKGPGYYMSNGVCCAHLNDPALWAKTQFFGNEYKDTRENLQGAIDIYNFILTDAITPAINITSSEGTRRTRYYQ